MLPGTRPLMPGASIRVTGIVQGVGFRPNAWRLAVECGVAGWVRNDARGVLIHAWGSADALDRFERRLKSDTPRLAHIDRITRRPLDRDESMPQTFRIVQSRDGKTHTGVAADSATCPECLAEINDASNRRYRYPFTNCTHCGPRLSIVEAVPYDRANTSMARFPCVPRADPSSRTPRTAVSTHSPTRARRAGRGPGWKIPGGNALQLRNRIPLRPPPGSSSRVRSWPSRALVASTLRAMLPVIMRWAGCGGASRGTENRLR